MRGVVLADTGPLYAEVDPNDSMHERSLEEQERLEAESIETAVPYATLQEAYVLVMRKLGITQAHSFMEDLIQGAILITPGEEDYEKAVRRVLRYPDQDISLTDAINAEISDRLRFPCGPTTTTSTSWAPASGACKSSPNEERLTPLSRLAQLTATVLQPGLYEAISAGQTR